MSALNNTQRYGYLPMTFHWIMLILLIITVSSMEFHGVLEKALNSKSKAYAVHFMFGLSILFLVIPRIMVRFAKPAPQIIPPLPRWQSISATLLHGSLYIVMIAMPMFGWLAVSAFGAPHILFFGLDIPPLMSENKELAKIFKEIHESFALVGLVLISLHVLSAIYHHFIRRDNTVLRMIPKHCASSASLSCHSK